MPELPEVEVTRRALAPVVEGRTLESVEVRERRLRWAVARSWMEAEAYCLNTYATASKLVAGGKIGAEASLNKIFWSELDLKMHETGLALLGHRAELMPEAPAAGDVGTWLDGFLFSLAGPIYAGTNEIQRNVIAERVLGMPRK